MTDDPFATDHFMDLVAASMGTLYPSRGAMQWADKLARQYGQERTILAIQHVMKDPRVPKHQSLSAAEQLLEYAATKAELEQDRSKDEELEQARADRNRREMEYQRGLARNAVPSLQPLAELMGDEALPWMKRDPV